MIPAGEGTAFAAFAAEWKRVGMPGEPHLEPDGSAAVDVESWMARCYYHCASGAQALAAFSTTEEADWETEALVCEALGVAACIRTEPTSCSACGGSLTYRDRTACTCNSCGATFRCDDDQWTKDTGSTRGRRRRKGVEHLLALAAAVDYHGLYTSLLAALPRCMGECGRPSRYMTTYSSEFSCGYAGCDKPDHDGDKWMAAPWKDHVDAVAALAPRRTMRKKPGKNKTPASALEVTPEDRAMASGHNVSFKHEDEVGGVAVGPASWVVKGSETQRAGYVRSREGGNPEWFSIIEIREFATALGIDVLEV